MMITCIVAVPRKAQISWEKNGQPLAVPSRKWIVFSSDATSQLHVHKVQREDSGNYTCVALMGFDVRALTADVQVKGTVLPPLRCGYK